MIGEFMANSTQTHLITAEIYLQQSPETTQPMELIGGEVVVSPAPKDIHVDVVAHILRILFASIPKDKGQIKTAPADIHFDELDVL